MADILIRASYFILMIAAAYGLKKAGILSKEDGVALARVILNLTLPCAIIVSFRTFVFEWSYMMIPAISLGANILMLAAGYMISRNMDRNSKVFYMLELPAYNIGNFTLPFVSGLLGASGVVASCLFDMGNSPMCIGLNAAITAMVVGAAGKNAVKSVLTIFTKPSFDVYLIMTILALFSIHLPEKVYDFAGMISPANGPLAMIMIGLMLEFSSDRSKIKEVLIVNALRLVLAAAIAFLFFRYAPFSYEVRKAVAITAFAPISSASPAFVADLKGDVELVGFVSTVSIICSLALMPFLFAFL